MDFLCSLKSYYKKNKTITTLIQLFFFSIIVIYFAPFWSSDFTFDYIYKFFQFDFVITGAFTLIFISMYSYLMLDSILIKSLYTILIVLNVLYAVLGIGFFVNSYRDFLSVLPQLILLFVLGFIYSKFKEHICINKYKISIISAIASIIIPLLLLNILGRIIFAYLA